MEDQLYAVPIKEQTSEIEFIVIFSKIKIFKFIKIYLKFYFFQIFLLG